MTEDQVEIRDARGTNRYFVDNAILDAFGSRLGPYGIAVYSVLVRRADNTSQTCYPSFQGIANMIGASRRKVMYEIQKLENLGLISIEHRSLESSIYTLRKVAVMGTEPSALDALVQDVHLAGAGGARPLVQDVHPNNTHINKTQENKTHDDAQKRTTPTRDPPIFSEAEFYYCDANGKKRLNKKQRETIAALVRDYGRETFKNSVDWLAKKGSSDLNAIETSCRNWNKNGGRNANANRRNQNTTQRKPTTAQAVTENLPSAEELITRLASIGAEDRQFREARLDSS